MPGLLPDLLGDPDLHLPVRPPEFLTLAADLLGTEGTAGDGFDHTWQPLADSLGGLGPVSERLDPHLAELVDALPDTQDTVEPALPDDIAAAAGEGELGLELLEGANVQGPPDPTIPPLPDVSGGLPPDTGAPPGGVELQSGGLALAAELQTFADRLGVLAAVVPVAPVGVLLDLSPSSGAPGDTYTASSQAYAGKTVDVRGTYLGARFTAANWVTFPAGGSVAITIPIPFDAGTIAIDGIREAGTQTWYPISVSFTVLP